MFFWQRSQKFSGSPHKSRYKSLQMYELPYFILLLHAYMLFLFSKQIINKLLCCSSESPPWASSHLFASARSVSSSMVIPFFSARIPRYAGILLPVHQNKWKRQILHTETTFPVRYRKYACPLSLPLCRRMSRGSDDVCLRSHRSKHCRFLLKSSLDHCF